MSKMLRLELLGLLLLACTQILTEHREFYGLRNQYGYRGGHHLPKTREVQIKYGRLKGFVFQPRTDNLQPVDVFRGVPFADPPIGAFRFEPPTTQTPWTGVRHFINFAPVCPQVLPNIEEVVDPTRHSYLQRLFPYLQNQSEDCLYLNIYAPHQDNNQRDNLKKFPVIMFIHGESYEWNSGNPYDGSVLAAYGNVVFVTVNFRLGILGFLRPSTKDDAMSNFGLLDQIAALVWINENIAKFGGDPDNVTLLGHGTGAVFVHLLLFSTVNELFHRAILMSGSGLNPDAIGKAPLQITKQVAHSVNCFQTNEDELAACLKSRSVEDLLNVKIEKPKYVPAFAPLIDKAVIRDTPANLMKQSEPLARFNLMYGVTELEKFHILPGVALLEGLSDSKRNEFIRESVKATHELDTDLILRKVLAHYGKGRTRGRTVDEYKWNRDLALEVISDSSVVAPMIATANLHSTVNPQSYMYVFTHQRSFRDDSNQQIRRTVHGEELPYVLGVPLGAGEAHHLSAPYDKGEALLSKAMMDWWSNFAYSGNPNNLRPLPRRMSYLWDDYGANSSYNNDWPEYDPENQKYFNLTTPPQISSRYRATEMEFWNEAIPHLLRRPKPEISTRRPRPGILDTLDRQYRNESGDLPPANVWDNSTNKELPSNLDDAEKPSDKRNKDEENGSGGALKNSSVVSLVIGFGVVFLLINLTALVYLYHKRHRMRKKASTASNLLARPHSSSRRSGNAPCSGNPAGSQLHHEAAIVKRSKSSKNDQQQQEQQRELGYCNSASKPDIRELIKNDKAYDNNSNFGRRSRENSSSTIDTRIKVREWIQQEIVHRCSPRFLRKTRETLQREHSEKLMKQQQRQQLEEQQQQQQQASSTEEHRQDDGELHRRRVEETLYEESRQIRVRPGVRRANASEKKPPKVSVAVDATPAARTDSILNQIPIELARVGASSEYLNSFEDATTILGTSEYCEPTEFQPGEVNAENARGGPNIVVIEHHHSRSDPLPMDKIPNYSTNKAISTAARINESDSGSTSSLYAKINPKTKSRLPLHQKHAHHQLQETMELEVRTQTSQATGESTTLPRLLTFGVPAASPNLVEVNVTSREVNPVRLDTNKPSNHEDALRTIKRRNYPKVLPDIEKRRSLPPNASFVIGATRQPQAHFVGHRQQQTPPSPPPRLYGTSRSLDCVEDKDEESEEEATAVMAVTTNLHVGPLRKKIDSNSNNQSVPSLTDPSEPPQLSSATSLPVCPIHGTSREAIPGAKSEPRIVITPLVESSNLIQPIKDEVYGVDQPDCPHRVIPERATKLPRIIIKPTGTIPRSQSTARATKPVVPVSSNLHENETYQRLLLARREKFPLPGENLVTRIPSFNSRRPGEQLERSEIVQRVNMPDAAATKL